MPATNTTGEGGPFRPDAAHGRGGGPPAWNRFDWGILAAVVLATFVTRFASRGRVLYSNDAGLLSSGVVSFDFGDVSPHPPYYPLTIAFGKALAPLVGPQDAIVLLSVFGSTAAVALAYALGHAVSGRLAGAVAAFVLFASPLAFLNGIAGLSYSLEAAGSVGVALAAWRFRAQPTRTMAWALGVSSSVAVGLRPSLLVFLAPLVVWAGWPLRRWWFHLAGAAFLTTLGWLLPAIVAGGGLELFLAGNRLQTRYVILSDTVVTGGFGALLRHVDWMAFHVRTEGPFLVASVLALGIAWAQAHQRWPTAPWPSFLAAWAVPPIAFYALVYVGWPVFPGGYLLSVLPPLAVGAAVCVASSITGIVATVPSRNRRVAGVVAVGCLLLLPASWLGDWSEASSGQRNQERWVASWAGFEHDFPSNETALLTSFRWPWARFEKSEYLTWAVEPTWNDTGFVVVTMIETRHLKDDRPIFAPGIHEAQRTPHPIPTWVRRVVVYEGGGDETPLEMLKSSAGVQNFTLPTGRVVRYFEPQGLASIEAAVTWYHSDGRYNEAFTRKYDPADALPPPWP